MTRDDLVHLRRRDLSVTDVCLGAGGPDVRERGVAVVGREDEVLQEPIEQPYGVRDCAFRDPVGNMLRFSQPRD